MVKYLSTVTLFLAIAVLEIYGAPTGGSTTTPTTPTTANNVESVSAVGGDSPGLLSGNVVQAPVNVPVNVCGNSINVVGLANPVSGNGCIAQ